MIEKIKSADLVTLSGGIVCTVGGLNLNKRWGAVLVGLGKGLDVIDGPVSRRSDPTSYARTLDKFTDRFTEGVVVGSLVNEGIVSPIIPALGYGLRSAIKTSFPNKDGNVFGRLGAYSKDIAIGAGLLATAFEEDTSTKKSLKKISNFFGVSAVSLAVLSVLDGEGSHRED